MTDYNFAYSNERIRGGLKESVVEVKEGTEVVARFAVWGYADEKERSEKAKAMLAGLVPTIEKIKADKEVHPAMKKTEVVKDTDLVTEPMAGEMEPE